MPKKKMTLDKIGRMMQDQFSELKKEINDSGNSVKKELKKEIRGVKKEIKDLKLTDGRIEKMLRAEIDRHDDQDLKYKNHEERIIILEQKDKIEA